MLTIYNYYPEELIAAIKLFVHKYNHQRYHESLNNLTPADVYYGRGDIILKERERIKIECINQRKSEYERSKKINKELTNKKYLTLN